MRLGRVDELFELCWRNASLQLLPGTERDTLACLPLPSCIYDRMRFLVPTASAGGLARGHMKLTDGAVLEFHDSCWRTILWLKAAQLPASHQSQLHVPTERVNACSLAFPGQVPRGPGNPPNGQSTRDLRRAFHNRPDWKGGALNRWQR